MPPTYHPRLQPASKPGGIKPTVLEVEDDSPGESHAHQINKDKPLPPMPSTEVSSTSGNEPAPGSKSDPKTADFQGDVAVNDEVPSKEMIEKAADIPVVDIDGKEMPFKSLYTPSEGSGDKGQRRTLIIFIRHFFCGVSSVPLLLYA